MGWALRFRIRQYLKGSLWIVPLAGGLLGFALSHLSVVIEDATGVPSGWHYSPSTAQTVLTTIVGAAVGLTGFVVTVTVLVVQMATGTFSARYMRIWYRDGVLKATLAMLVGTLMFAYALLRRIGDSVPDLGVTIAGLLLSIGVVLFLVFLDRCIHRLRPVAVAALVARSGRRSARATAELTTSPTTAELEHELVLDSPTLVVATATAGAIQAIDRPGIVAWARRHGSVVVLPHAVGDFVSTGTTLMAVHGGTVPVPAVAERRLRQRVALGMERTIDQDAAFALRVMVDVAIRALSPAVNDPTTAVQVIDHLSETLATIGRTPGLNGLATLRDESGDVRVLMPEQRWEDYLGLAVTEIREYGASAVQVMRRLRVLLLDLRETVRPEYAAALDDELARLDATIEASFRSRPDTDLARQPDRQGIGAPPPFDPNRG